MKRAKLVLAWIAALAVGCGGGGGRHDGYDVGSGEISGVVLDANGNVVRDALVTAEGRQTRTNSIGSYVLQGVRAVDTLVFAQATGPDGTRYAGENLARVYDGERARSVSIAIYPTSRIRRLSGRVLDARGIPVVAAQVFARQHTDTETVLSSSTTLTDRDGRFILDGLSNDLRYDLVVNAQGYGEATDTLEAGAGDGTANFTLGAATTTNLPAPTGFAALAWTSPATVTRDRNAAQAIEAVKRLIDKSRAGRMKVTRDTPAGNPIEVDLTWDAVNLQNVLGFGIYYGTTPDNLEADDFLRDAQGQFYADGSASSFVGQTSYYAVATLGTDFDENTGRGIGGRTETLGVTPLGDLTLQPTVGSTLAWSPATGATQYSVFLFADYPTVGVTALYDNFDAPTSGTSFTIPEPLASRRRYYYVVVGRNDDDTARTVSPVGSFTAP